MDPKQLSLIPSYSSEDLLHDKLIRLGDMMGDGLHHESDGKWIEKEYKKVFNMLYPEYKQERRLQKAKIIDEKILKLIEKIQCKKCEGTLKQSRKGSIIMYCTLCNIRYKAVSSKSKKSK